MKKNLQIVIVGALALVLLTSAIVPTFAKYAGTFSAGTIKLDVKASQYTLNFDSDGGTACTNKTVYYQKAIGELPYPDKDYHVFMGWYTSDGTKLTENDLYPYGYNVTLKAKWTKIIDPDRPDTDGSPTDPDYFKPDNLMGSTGTDVGYAYKITIGDSNGSCHDPAVYIRPAASFDSSEYQYLILAYNVPEFSEDSWGISAYALQEGYTYGNEQNAFAWFGTTTAKKSNQIETAIIKFEGETTGYYHNNITKIRVDYFDVYDEVAGNNKGKSFYLYGYTLAKTQDEAQAIAEGFTHKYLVQNSLHLLPDEVAPVEPLELDYSGIDDLDGKLQWNPVSEYDDMLPRPNEPYVLFFEAGEGYTLPEIITVEIDSTTYGVRTDGNNPESEPTFDPTCGLLTIPAILLTEETKTIRIEVAAVPVEVGPSEPPSCTCGVRCTDLNADCAVCSTDISTCIGEEPDTTPICTCETRCTDLNADCAVCGTDVSSCGGTESQFPADDPVDEPLTPANTETPAAAETPSPTSTETPEPVNTEVPGTPDPAVTPSEAALPPETSLPEYTDPENDGE